MKVNFKLPNTKLCLVLCYDNNKPSRPLPKVLVPTPATNEGLRSAMLNKGIGYSQIRAVQPVKEQDLAKAMQPSFRRA
jgi:hypothetical protein